MRFFICGIGLSVLPAVSLAHAAPMSAWVARSNLLVEPVLQDEGRFSPEAASANGKDEFDTAVIDLAPGIYERRLAALTARRDALVTQRAAESDPKTQNKAAASSLAPT